MTGTGTIRLLLADVDGTLVTPDKQLTDRAVAAVRKLGDAGILFAITSGRPPKGMSMLIGPLDITTPIAAFNGGPLVNRDMSVGGQGGVARYMSARYGIPPEAIATIGDMPNDVLMFAHSRLSIAMGNARPEVQSVARRVTASNADEGFANAVEKFILPPG